MKPIRVEDHHRQFQRKDRKPICIKAKQKRDEYSFRNLPFVAGKREKAMAEAWTVPASGGYFGGYTVGEAMALCYLKHDRVHGRMHTHYDLCTVVLSLFKRVDELGGMAAMEDARSSDLNDGIAAIRGQVVGFLNTISDRMTLASKMIFHDLDTIDEEELLNIANIGLNFDHAAYMRSLKD